MKWVQVHFFLWIVAASYIYSFLDDMSSAELPVDFAGQEVEMGLAWKNTISFYYIVQIENRWYQIINTIS